MADHRNVHGRRRGRGIRPWLIGVKMIGLTGFLGGLAAMAALGFFGPEPETREGWVLLKQAMRGIFFPCFFAGLMLTIAAGLALWLQMPRTFLRMRWFRLKAVLLAILIPGSHLWARSRALELYEAIDRGPLGEIPAHWRSMSTAFLISLVAMLAVALIGRIKPRLGQPMVPAAKPRTQKASDVDAHGFESAGAARQ
jgi:hypothetical protein